MNQLLAMRRKCAIISSNKQLNYINAMNERGEEEKKAQHTRDYFEKWISEEIRKFPKISLRQFLRISLNFPQILGIF